jgi:hypothetical protein
MYIQASPLAGLTLKSVCGGVSLSMSGFCAGDFLTILIVLIH